MDKFFKQLSQFLGEFPWLAGDSLTMADFVATEYIDLLRMFAPEIYAKYENLHELLKRFNNLPNIKKYYNEKNGLRWPINGRPAKWGGEDMEAPKNLIFDQ